MKTQFDIDALIRRGEILDELEFERALIADRKLRVLAKEDPGFKDVRKKLRDLLQDFENKNWSNASLITPGKIHESDIAELIAEKERQFIQRRKELIRAKLKSLDLTQQDLGVLLGHNSKSYISELMNGVCPFSLKDLVVINRLLKINLVDLIPTFLPQSDRSKIAKSIEQLGNPKLKLTKTDLLKV